MEWIMTTSGNPDLKIKYFIEEPNDGEVFLINFGIVDGELTKIIN